MWDCELAVRCAGGVTASAASRLPIQSLLRIRGHGVEDSAAGEVVVVEEGVVSNMARRRREPTKHPECHGEMYHITFLYSLRRYPPGRRHGRRDKSDTTYSNRPCLRYGTLSAARRAGFDIQNLLRIKFRIDFVREVFLGGCARNGWEDVEFCMQSSSTLRNDKSERRSRPSQLRGRVLKRREV